MQEPWDLMIDGDIINYDFFLTKTEGNPIMKRKYLKLKKRYQILCIMLRLCEKYQEDHLRGFDSQSIWSKWHKWRDGILDNLKEMEKLEHEQDFFEE